DDVYNELVCGPMFTETFGKGDFTRSKRRIQSWRTDCDHGPIWRREDKSSQYPGRL
ncbi:hypothetical protein L9F63_021327, partial [Diploptera punctata]